MGKNKETPRLSGGAVGKERGEKCLNRWANIATIIGVVITLLLGIAGIIVSVYFGSKSLQLQPVVVILKPEEPTPVEKVTLPQTPERKTLVKEATPTAVIMEETPAPKVTPTISIGETTALNLIPGISVSGLLMEFSSVLLRIADVPEACNSLLIRLEGAPNVQFEFEVYKADECIGKGSIGHHFIISKPESLLYCIKVIARRGSGDFMLSAECQELAPLPTPTHTATTVPQVTLTPTDTPMVSPTSKPRPTDTPTAALRPTPTSTPRPPTPTQTPRPPAPKPQTSPRGVMGVGIGNRATYVSRCSALTLRPKIKSYGRSGMYILAYARAIGVITSIVGIFASLIVISLGIHSICKKEANLWITIVAVVIAIISLVVPVWGYYYAARLFKSAISKPIIRLIPGVPISGLLAQHDELYFSIDAPKDINPLIIRLEGSSEADFEFKVYEANQFLDKGSLDNPIVIYDPEDTTYYVTIMSRHASGSFTLIAE